MSFVIKEVVMSATKQSQIGIVVTLENKTLSLAPMLLLITTQLHKHFYTHRHNVLNTMVASSITFVSLSCFGYILVHLGT